MLAAPARPDQAQSVTAEFLADVYEVLRGTYEYIIVDTPPAFTPEVIATIDVSSSVCMVGMLDALSLKNTRLGLETLELMGYESDRVWIVLNRANTSVGINRTDVVSILGRAPDVLIPSHRDIASSVNEGAPVVISQKRSDAARAFEALAGNVLVACASSRSARRPSRSQPDPAREVVMELRERLANNRVESAPEAPGRVRRPEGQDPPRRHLRPRAAPLQRRASTTPSCSTVVLADIRNRLSQERGLAIADRDRLLQEIADDTLGHGPIEPLLQDDTRQRGHGQRAQRRLGGARRQAAQDAGPLQRRASPAADHQQDRRADRAPDRRVLADGRRAPARRQPRQRRAAAAVARSARC